MASEVVNLLAPGNPPEVVIGTATLEDLPDERYPSDLQWLAPFIEVDGRYFSFVANFSFGPQQASTYVEVQPLKVQGQFVPPKV